MKLTVQYLTVAPLNETRYFCMTADPTKCTDQTPVAPDVPNYYCKLSADYNCVKKDIDIIQIKNQYDMCVQIETCLYTTDSLTWAQISPQKETYQCVAKATTKSLYEGYVLTYKNKDDTVR